MSTSRRRRIRAHRDEVLAQHAEQGPHLDAEVAHIQKFDDALPKVFAWVAITVFAAIAILVVVA